MSEYGVWIGFILALIAFGAIGWASSKDKEPKISMMLLVFGGLFGWTTGILITPEESQIGKFSEYGTAIGTFVSGYLIAKLDRVFELRIGGNTSAIDSTFLLRLLVLGSAFMLGVLSTFIWRTYVSAVAASA